MTNEKQKQKTEKDSASGNGHQEFSSEQVLGAMQRIAELQGELSERLQDLEEKVSNSSVNPALLRMVNLFYDTDDKHIAELSHISPLAARPFAAALTLDMMTDPAVQDGTISLNKLLILNFLRLQRSVKGKHFALGIPVLQTQVSNEEESKADEFNMGDQ